MSETAVNGVEPIIFLDDVHVTFRTRTGSILHPNLVHAVQGVTIKLMPGQTIGIVGESGCGKSTTANVMCGLQAPTSGKVYFKGKDVTKRTAEDRRHMGRVISVVFQNPATALNPRMVVREQLLDPMRVHNLGTEAEQEKRVKELLELTGLPSSAAEVLPGQLSGGQRQRVAIARALSLNPDAIIADEPTSALDVSVRAQILNLLTDLKKELGLAMVFISHDIQTVRYISDDIIVMNGGKIVEQGEAKQVFQHPQDPYTKMLLGAAPALPHPKRGLYPRFPTRGRGFFAGRTSVAISKGWVHEPCQVLRSYNSNLVNIEALCPVHRISISFGRPAWPRPTPSSSTTRLRRLRLRIPRPVGFSTSGIPACVALACMPSTLNPSRTSPCHWCFSSMGIRVQAAAGLSRRRLRAWAWRSLLSIVLAKEAPPRTLVDLRARRSRAISSPVSTATRPTSTMSAYIRIFAFCAVSFASSRASILPACL